MYKRQGIDDTVTGVWVGGLIVSMIIWTIDWLKKKKWIFMRMELLISFGYFLLVVTPLYSSGIIGQLYNTLWGIDKLIVGIIFGAIGFWLIATLYNRMKARNNGHANFPFQKVVMPLAALTIISVCFYFITK